MAKDTKKAFMQGNNVKDTKKAFMQGNNVIAQLLRMIFFGQDAGRSDYSK